MSEAEVSSRQKMESLLLRYGESLSEYQQIVKGDDISLKSFGEDCSRYIGIATSLLGQLEQERRTTNELKKLVEKLQAKPKVRPELVLDIRSATEC